MSSPKPNQDSLNKDLKKKKKKKFTRFNPTKHVQEKKVNEDVILASGSMVINSKPGSLVASQPLRNIGSEVAILQHNGEKLSKKLSKKKKTLEKVKKEISEKETEIKNLMIFPPKPKDYLRGEVDSDKEETNEQKIREIKTLENRIENLIPKYNSVVVENRMIREKIDALRKEKNFSWQEIYENLEKDLQKKKTEMSTSIMKAEKACRERELIKEEIQMLKLQDEEEEKEYKKKVEELTKYIKKDKQVLDYLKKKKELEQADRDETESKKPSEKTDLKSRIRAEKNIRNKVIDKINELSPCINGIESIHEDGLPENKDLEALLDERKRKKEASTNNTELEKLQETENQNFRLNYFVNELKEESEKIDQEIEEIKQQIRDTINNDSDQIDTMYPENQSEIESEVKMKNTSILKDNIFDEEGNLLEEPSSILNRNTIPRSETSRTEDKTQVSKMQNQNIYDAGFQEELAKAQQEESNYQRRIKEADKTIDSLKLGIKSIYERIGIDKTNSNEVLKGYSISEGNLMEYLRLIENNTTELVNIFNQSKNINVTNEVREEGIGKGNKRDERNVINVASSSLPDFLSLDTKIPFNEKDPQLMSYQDLMKRAYKD
ncbi:unnamed protein product [Moneuplotes crassus]|uniref:ODAD1 central coiled coil region domain-containing protein n=1 Tax=Euplotes crassus TaxID=5936 RepID=A0AAD1X8L5_EUPCR|nr:unnamed protein product [Moneuplotes crassus]